jgi:hypothetical protein
MAIPALVHLTIPHSALAHCVQTIEDQVRNSRGGFRRQRPCLARDWPALLPRSNVQTHRESESISQMGTSAPRAQPFTNTLKRQSSAVASLRVVKPYLRRTAAALSPSSLYLITRATLLRTSSAAR